MKANAPEKIYLERILCSNEVYDNWKSQKTISDDIEYTRTDALIEKAANWLRTHSEADYFQLISSYNYCGAGNLNKKRMIEDFKEYMEE